MAGARPVLGLLTLLLAGCLDETGRDPSLQGTGSETRPGTDATDGPPIPPVRLDGTLVRLPDGFAVNVSAYNAGAESLGHSRKFFESNYQYAWSASLSGPPGDDLDYASPDQAEDSSTHANGAGYTRAPMPPGSYVNWTYAGPHETGECRVLPDCSNWWDGNLTLDGERQPAPAGTYTWRFTFTYNVPESVDPDGRTSRREAHIDFQVEIATSPQ